MKMRSEAGRGRLLCFYSKMESTQLVKLVHQPEDEEVVVVDVVVSVDLALMRTSPAEADCE